MTGWIFFGIAVVILGYFGFQNRGDLGKLIGRGSDSPPKSRQ